MAGPGEAGQVRHQEFPAPDGAVGAVARAVQGDADTAFGAAVFRQAGGDMGVMVLHPDAAHPGQPLGIAGAEIEGVKVMGDDGRVLAAQGLKMGDGVLKIIKSLHGIQVADVLAEQGDAVGGHTEGVLLFGPDAQDGLRIQGQINGRRHQTPGPPQGDHGRGIDGADHGVVAGHLDVPVMQEEGVSQARQFVPGLVVRVHQGLFAEVAAGHDQGGGAVLHEQKVQGGVGQHEPQEPVARGHVGRDAGVRPPPGQDDGPFPGEEQ